jgi:hypothetical protein
VASPGWVAAPPQEARLVEDPDPVDQAAVPAVVVLAVGPAAEVVTSAEVVAEAEAGAAAALPAGPKAPRLFTARNALLDNERTKFTSAYTTSTAIRLSTPSHTR